MDNIKEINRTLVIEKFTDEEFRQVNGRVKPWSLTQALLDAVDDENVFNYRNVDISALEVKSFDEFLERFSPMLYQAFIQDDNGMRCVYSTDPDEYKGAVPVNFDKTAFFKAAIDMYEKKAVSGQSNYEFDYSCFSKLISPQSLLKEAKKKRQNYQFSMLKMLEAKDAKNTALASRYKKKTIGIANDIKDTYKNNMNTVLALKIADYEVRLGLTENSGVQNGGTPALETTKKETFRLTYNNDGDLVKEKVTVANLNGNAVNSAMMLEDRAAKQTKLLLETKLSGDDESINPHIQELIVSTYSGNAGLVVSEDIPKIKKEYEQHKSVYKAMQESLLLSVNKIIEKMIDVKALFDNAGENISVIIANCTAEDITNNSGIMKNFENYMTNINGNIEYKIWFAVLPQIDDPDFVDEMIAGKSVVQDIKSADDEDDEDIIDVEYTDENGEQNGNILDDDFGWDNEDEEETVKRNLVSLDSANQILHIMAKAKCITFFGYKGCEKTGFGKMNLARLKNYQKKLKNINSRYAVFAYPNFTLMSGLQAGDIEVAVGETILNPGMYIDAPYIAAGLTVKSLNSKELKKEKFEVKKELPQPCVRFDFEEAEYRYRIKTNMNCEEILNYDDDLLRELEESPYGFFFDSCGYDNGSKVKNAFVRYARNMEADGKNRIFATLVKDFIWLEMTKGEKKVDKKTIDAFKADHKWNRHENAVNNPLRHGEDYGYEVNQNGKYEAYVRFNNVQGDDVFDDLEIIDEEDN